MYSSQHRTSSNADNSSDTPTPSQFAQRPFAFQPQVKPVIPQQNKTPEKQIQKEEVKPNNSSVLNAPIFSYWPSPSVTPGIQMKLSIGQPTEVYQQQAVPSNPMATQFKTNTNLSALQNTTLESSETADF